MVRYTLQILSFTFCIYVKRLMLNMIILLSTMQFLFDYWKFQN